MKTKVLQVFYNENGLPFKDQERTVHFPVIGSGFMGASNTTQIKFYFKEIGDDAVKYVAVSKLPNGKVGSKVLENYYDSELDEPYALLELDSYYTQYKGDLFISLQGYQGGVQVTYDEDTELYEIEGTPTIQATGSIKFTNNYATQFVGSGEEQNVTLQQLLAIISDTVLRYNVEYSNTLAEVFNEIGTKICVLNIEGDEYLCEMSDVNRIVLYDIYSQEWYAFTGSGTNVINDVLQDSNKQIIATKEDLENFGNLFTYKGTASVSEINALTDIGNGWCYNLTDSGTLTLGNLQVEQGDNVAFNGTIWTKLSSETVLGQYYTKQEGQEFEQEIDNRVDAIENQVQQVASGSPKGVYATLAALQAAYPTGAEGIYVVQADGHWYYWNGSAWTDGGVYQTAMNYDELEEEINSIEKLLQFANEETTKTISNSGYNNLLENLTLKKGFTYIATWELSSPAEGNGWCYIYDANNNNQFNGSTNMAVGKTKFQVLITPTETKKNLTVKYYSNSLDIGKNCTFTLTTQKNKIDEFDENFDVIEKSVFENYKVRMSFGVGTLADSGAFSTDYPYRVTNNKSYVFDTDVTISIEDGFRFGYCTYPSLDSDSRTAWSGWLTGTHTISAGTIFRLQCARISNESSYGVIINAYDNAIYDALTVKVKSSLEDKIDSYHSFEYGHNGLKIELFYNDMLWSQGACLVDNLMVGFDGSNDAHTNTAQYRSFFYENGYVANATGSHNLGHCASADYNNETDTILVANGTTTQGVIPTLYLISGAKNIVTNGDNIMVTDSNIIAIEMTNSLGNGVIACFGENSNIVYAMLTEDASNFNTKSKRYLYKLFLGKGSINMVSLYPTKSFGTFISGKGDNEYNGTAYVMNVYEGDYFVELQGIKYLNGRIALSCDCYINNVLTGYILYLKTIDKDNTFVAEKSLWVTSLKTNGEYVRTETEDIVISNNYGYISFYQIDGSWNGKTYKFKLF